MKPTTPKPVVVTTICSECGLAWESHGDKPTTSDCIRLLKSELVKRPAPMVITYPTYPAYPWYQWSYTQGISNTIPCTTTYNTCDNTLNDGHTITVNTMTPQISSTTCNAVAA